MKKSFKLITVFLLCTFFLTGCLRSYSLFYDSDELKQNLVRAEIIYMERSVDFFVIHWYVDVEEIEYEVVRELTSCEADRLLRGLSNIEFTFTVLWVPASVSNIFSMRGYAIKLTYEPSQRLSSGREPFIIVAQTGDYRYGMRGFPQARIGRTASDEDWNVLMSELYFERGIVSRFDSYIFDVMPVVFIVFGIVLLSGRGTFIFAGYTAKLGDKKVRYDARALCKIVGRFLLIIIIVAHFTNWLN